MHYTGQVYRPPTEAYTPLLEVTAGCSHNSCAFCTMYRDTPFRISPEEDIIADLKELSAYMSHIERLYLLNGDPFVLPAARLLRIAGLVRRYLPAVRTITCYCSIRDLMQKTEEELEALGRAGYGQLYIGIETAWDPALAMINKGCTAADEYAQLERLKKAGIDYFAIVMCGIAGKGRSEENVRETAKLLNEFRPAGVLPMSTSVAPGSRLEELRDAGEYNELTEGEILEEEIALLKALELPPATLFFGLHVFNTVPVSGYFDEKERLLDRLQSALDNMPEEERNSIRARGHI